MALVCGIYHRLIPERNLNPLHIFHNAVFRQDEKILSVVCNDQSGNLLLVFIVLGKIVHLIGNADDGHQRSFWFFRYFQHILVEHFIISETVVLCLRIRFTIDCGSLTALLPRLRSLCRFVSIRALGNRAFCDTFIQNTAIRCGTADFRAGTTAVHRRILRRCCHRLIHLLSAVRILVARNIHFGRRLLFCNCTGNLWLCHSKDRGRNQTAKCCKNQPSGNQQYDLFPVRRLLFDALFHEFVRFWVIFHTFLSPYIRIPFRTALRIRAPTIFTYIRNFTR